MRNRKVTIQNVVETNKGKATGIVMRLNVLIESKVDAMFKVIGIEIQNHFVFRTDTAIYCRMSICFGSSSITRLVGNLIYWKIKHTSSAFTGNEFRDSSGQIMKQAVHCYRAMPSSPFLFQLHFHQC